MSGPKLKPFAMKKIIIPFCLAFVVLISGAGFSANNAEAENPLLGSWVFNVAQAPWEYSKGKVVFEENKEEELSGKIIFTSGREIKIAKITQEDDKVTFKVNVDGMPVKTIVTLEENDIKGFVETNEGNMPFNAERELTEK